MTLYTCITCEKVFKQKIIYSRHLKRKKPCVSPGDSDSDSDKKKENVTNTLMNKVDVIIKTNQLLVKSNDKLVKSNKELTEEMKKIKKELTGEIKRMKKDIMILNKKCNNKIIINNIAHADVVNNNNNLISYGNEDFKKIDTSELLHCCKQGFKSAVHLTKTVHFNSKYPEFHNVYISNIRNQYAMVYKNNEWETVIKSDLLDEIYDNCKNYIEDNRGVFNDKLTKSQKQSLQRWIDTHDVNENDVKIKKIKNDLRLLLFNQRKMVINK